MLQKMALEAKKIGVDIIKYQMHIPEKEMLKNKIKFWGGSLDEILNNYNLSINDHKKLIAYCKKINIQYLCTPFCPEAVDILNDLGVEGFKTGSGEMLNLPLLDRIIKTKKPLILSTGMSTLAEVDFIVNYLKKNKAKFLITNCTSVYPCPSELVNLNLINYYKNKYKILVGHSDHTSDIWSSLGAVTLGANVIEKHFTLSKALKGPDWEVSLEPNNFKKMIIGAREINKSLKQKKIEKKINPKELPVRNWANHSIVSIKPIKKNEKFTTSNISVKRPSGGLPALDFFKVLNLKSKKNIKENQQIKKYHL